MGDTYKGIVCETDAAIILAAGASTRMGGDKISMPLAGETPVSLCVKAFYACGFRRIIITAGCENFEYLNSIQCGGNINVVMGGGTRQESVLNALRRLPEDTRIVAVHDAARCLVTPELIMSTVESALRHGSGIAAIGCRDTVRDAHTGKVIERGRLIMAQTPQTFSYPEILSAYERAEAQKLETTDDCSIYELMGHKAEFVDGNIINQKLTYQSDMPFFEAVALHRLMASIRVGYGEDTHRLAEGRKLVIGGVDIPFRLGLLGHSDADVLVHSAIDALLGACAQGDIGRSFPDTDEEYRNISSIELLRRTGAKLAALGVKINNLDATVIAQEPRLMPYIERMRKNLSSALGLNKETVSVKATTPEHTGPEGRMECISARCVACVTMPVKRPAVRNC